MDWRTVLEGILIAGLVFVTGWLMLRVYVVWLHQIKRQRFLKDPVKWYLKEIERLSWKISPDLALIKYYRSQVNTIDWKKRDELERERGIEEAVGVDTDE